MAVGLGHLATNINLNALSAFIIIEKADRKYYLIKVGLKFVLCMERTVVLTCLVCRHGHLSSQGSDSGGLYGSLGCGCYIYMYIYVYSLCEYINIHIFFWCALRVCFCLG